MSAAADDSNSCLTCARKACNLPPVKRVPIVRKTRSGVVISRPDFWGLLAALLLLAGCGANPDATHLYQLEKLFYQAEREVRSAGIDPAGLDNTQRQRLAELYGKTAEYYRAVRGSFRGGSSSPTVRSAETIAIQSSLRMAALLSTTTDSDRALRIYQSIPTDYPAVPAYHAIARFELGRLFERRRQWDSAWAVYHELLYTYRPPPDTVSGYDMDWLRIPLHIAEVYDQLDLRPLAAAWLDSGLVFYRRVRDEYPAGTVNAIAKTNLATIHRVKGELRAAIDVLRTITDSTGKVIPEAQVEIGDLFYEGLKMPDSALGVFMAIVSRQPDSPAATIAQTKIAAIYIDQKKFPQARDILRPLKEAYEKKGKIVAGILLLLGRSYEEEGAWDRALNEYSWLVENFPTLKQSMDVMLHIIERMAAQNNLPVARQWQKTAREQFEKQIAQNPNTEPAATAQTYLARSCLLAQDWEGAAKEYQTLIDTYPPALARPQAYLELSSVYADKLGNAARGIAVLEKLLSDFPDFRPKDEVTRRIEFLKTRSS